MSFTSPAVTQMIQNDNEFAAPNTAVNENKLLVATEQRPAPDLIAETATIVAAFVGSQSISLEQLPSIIRTVHQALRAELIANPAMPASSQQPAVPVNQSVMGEYLVCLEDGKKMRMLKRYLRTQFNMTPEDYKAKWNLPATYPMTAPGYSKKRSAFAKQFGLGRQPGSRKKAA